MMLPEIAPINIYSKISIYLNENGFNFNIDEQPTIESFEKIIGEKSIKVATCVFNTRDNFSSERRSVIDGINYDGKLVDYFQNSPMFNDKENEYIYFLAYNNRIVKIGMTITPIKDRCQSYMCGTRKAMKKGSCSTTNYIITECNYAALKNNYKVEIFAIKIPKENKTVTRFNMTREVEVSIARGYEEMITDKFIETYGYKPILCVQKGKSTK